MRTMAEILSGEGVHHKTAYTETGGRSEYAVVAERGTVAQRGNAGVRNWRVRSSGTDRAVTVPHGQS